MPDRTPTGEETITVAAADGSNPHKYPLAVDPQTGLLGWTDHSDPDQEGEPGKAVSHTWQYFGGGMGKTFEDGQGGYYFSENWYHGDPWVLKPRPTITSITLTGNTIVPEYMFEAQSAAGTKFLYVLAGSKVFKINIATKTLVNTKDLTTASVYFRTGAYTGTGAASRAITGLGFAPDCVIVKVDGATAPLIRIRGMAANTSKLWTGTTATTNILSLDDDGFTVATNSNTSGYTFHWIAWKESAGYVDIGSYAGDGNATQAITGVGFQPNLLWVFDATSDADEGEVVARHSTHNANEAIVYHDGHTFSDCLASLDADGFTVKNNTRVNASGHTYWYIAFKVLTDHFTVGTYVGDGTDNRNLGDADLTPDIGYTPQYVIASRYGTSVSVHRSDTCSGDSTMQYAGTANQTNQIQALIADGFQVGSNATVQTTSATYHYAAWTTLDGGIPIFGRTAKWNDIVHLPCGDDVDFKCLTVITDDTADDTWTGASGLKAQHFCVVENAIVRARSERRLGKCTADDTTTAGNWSDNVATGGYYVGQPGEYITDLIAVGNECGICTDQNFYLFDNVAVAKAMLGKNKPSNADNGKGALQFYDWTLLPYGGLQRYTGGAAVGFGPDSIPGYVSVNGISNEPTKLSHYALDCCENYVYAAAKDAQSTAVYHIFMGTREPGVERMRWDGLLRHTAGTVIKVIFVDSTPSLWFGNGTDVSYIPLSKDGKPEGGTFGEANLTSNSRCYLGVIDFGTTALKRLRVIEVQTRNNVGSTLQFVAQVYRDAGSVEGVGAAFYTDGLIERYWAPGTADTARRVCVALAWATVGYTPVAADPEVFCVTARAEVLPKDADLIEATVILRDDNDGTAKTKNSRLKARVGAGASKIWDRDGEVIYGTIYAVSKGEMVVEEGKPSAKRVTVYMRRGDIA